MAQKRRSRSLSKRKRTLRRKSGGKRGGNNKMASAWKKLTSMASFRKTKNKKEKKTRTRKLRKSSITRNSADPYLPDWDYRASGYGF